MTENEVFPQVQEIIADVLVIDKEEVELKKRLTTDLGAESIDFLDLVFQLERTFDIKIPRGQLEKNARGVLTEEEFAPKGVLSERGMQALRDYFSEVPADYFQDNMKADQIPNLFTVETFCKLVANAKQEIATA